MTDFKFQKCSCRYCERWGFPMIWKGLPKDSFWYEIPKNGSWSIKMRYKKLKDSTKTPISADDKIYIIWRHPESRFMSVFSHYFLEEGGRFTLTQDYFKQHGIEIKKIPIKDRIDLCLNNLFLFDSTMEVHHFYPQTYFINQKYKDNFEIIDIRNISKLLGVKSLNSTPKKRFKEIEFTDIHLEKIREIYRDDYKFMEKMGL